MQFRTGTGSKVARGFLKRECEGTGKTLGEACVAIHICSPRCKGSTFASCRLSTEGTLLFLHPQYPTAEEPASKCKVRKLHLDVIELSLFIFLHLTKTFCRKRLCLIVPCVSSYRWAVSLELFYFVNLTSSCSLIPRIHLAVLIQKKKN